MPRSVGECADVATFPTAPALGASAASKAATTAARRHNGINAGVRLRARRRTPASRLRQSWRNSLTGISESRSTQGSKANDFRCSLRRCPDSCLPADKNLPKDLPFDSKSIRLIDPQRIGFMCHIRRERMSEPHSTARQKPPLSTYGSPDTPPLTIFVRNMNSRH